jgi:hypothetical protein
VIRWGFAVRFGSAEEITAHADNLKVGAAVYLVESRAKPLDETVHIYAGKASDASNKDDEEPAGACFIYSPSSSETLIVPCCC